MIADKALLKIYADEQRSRRSLASMERSVKTYGLIAVGLALILAYLITNEIEGYRGLLLILCPLSAVFSWLSYTSIHSYKKELDDLPLLYSFYTHGFISHRGEQEYSWEHIAKLNVSKTGLILEMTRNPHKTARLAFLSISDTSIDRILRHFKTYAPARLSKKIKL